MCRGVKLGPCIAEGCETPIRCRDTNGFCDEHDPYDFSYCDCEGDCECPPVPRRPAINEAKRLDYVLDRNAENIRGLEASLVANRFRLKEAKRHGADLRRRRKRLAAASVSAPVIPGGQRDNTE